MKEYKRQYRELFNELKDFKAASNFNQQSIDNAKLRIVNDFEQWYDDNFDLGMEEEVFMPSPGKNNQSPPKGALNRNSPTKVS